jgi:hypothetical protein
MKRAIAIWVLGLVTLVPYGAWYLLFEAPREEYAILIVLILFWIFGYWGLVGAILMALKLRAVYRAVKLARSPEDLQKALESPQARDVAIDLIARDNHIPRFLAEPIFDVLVRHLRKPGTLA